MRLEYGLLGAVHLALFLIAAYEIVSSGKSMPAKVAWLVVILLLPVVGLIAYYLIGRGK